MDLPIGAIIMWYKSTGEIPAGWHLCDGNEGTPDLRGKYVVGVSTDNERVPTGNTSHHHTNSSTNAGGSHFHDVTGSIGGTVSSVGVSQTGSGVSGMSPTHGHAIDLDLPDSGTHQHTTSDTNETNNNPPYLQLHFIMRIL